MQRKYSKIVRDFVNVVTAPPQIYNVCQIPLLKDSQLLSIKCPGFPQIDISIINRLYDVFPKVYFNNFFGMIRSNLGRCRGHLLCKVFHESGRKTLYVLGRNFIFDRSRQKLMYVVGYGDNGPLIYVDGEVWRNDDNPDYKYLRTKVILPALDFMDDKVSLVITDTEPFWKVSRFFSENEGRSILLEKLWKKYNGEQKDKECDK